MRTPSLLSTQSGKSHVLNVAKPVKATETGHTLQEDARLTYAIMKERIKR